MNFRCFFVPRLGDRQGCIHVLRWKNGDFAEGQCKEIPVVPSAIWWPFWGEKINWNGLILMGERLLVTVLFQDGWKSAG